MKLSEYIAGLQKVLEKEGDLPVLEGAHDGEEMEPLEEIADWQVQQVITYTNIVGRKCHDPVFYKRDWMTDVEEFKAFVL